MMDESRRAVLVTRLQNLRGSEIELHDARKEISRLESELRASCNEAAALRRQLADAREEHTQALETQKKTVAELSESGRKMDSLMRQLVEDRNRLGNEVRELQRRPPIPLVPQGVQMPEEEVQRKFVARAVQVEPDCISSVTQTVHFEQILSSSHAESIAMTSPDTSFNFPKGKSGTFSVPGSFAEETGRPAPSLSSIVEPVKSRKTARAKPSRKRAVTLMSQSLPVAQLLEPSEGKGLTASAKIGSTAAEIAVPWLAGMKTGTIASEARRISLGNEELPAEIAGETQAHTEVIEVSVRPVPPPAEIATRSCTIALEARRISPIEEMLLAEVSNDNMQRARDKDTPAQVAVPSALQSIVTKTSTIASETRRISLGDELPAEIAVNKEETRGGETQAHTEVIGVSVRPVAPPAEIATRSCTIALEARRISPIEEVLPAEVSNENKQRARDRDTTAQIKSIVRKTRPIASETRSISSVDVADIAVVEEEIRVTHSAPGIVASPDADAGITKDVHCVPRAALPIEELKMPPPVRIEEEQVPVIELSDHEEEETTGSEPSNEDADDPRPTKVANVPTFSPPTNAMFSPPSGRTGGVVSLLATSPSVLRPVPLPQVLQGSSRTPPSLLLAIAICIAQRAVVRVVEEGACRYVGLCDHGWWQWFPEDLTGLSADQLPIEAYDEDGQFLVWPSVVQLAVQRFFSSTGRHGDASLMDVVYLVKLLVACNVEGPFAWGQIDSSDLADSLRRKAVLLVLVDTHSGGEAFVSAIEFQGDESFGFFVHVTNGRLQGEWLPLATLRVLFQSVFLCRAVSAGTKEVRFRTMVDSDGFADLGLCFPAHLATRALSDRLLLRFFDRGGSQDHEGTLVPLGAQSYRLMCPALRRFVPGEGRGQDGNDHDCICIVHVVDWAVGRADLVRFGFILRPAVDPLTGTVSVRPCSVVAQVDGNTLRVSTLDRGVLLGESNDDEGNRSAEGQSAVSVIAVGCDASTTTELNVMRDTAGDDRRLVRHPIVVEEMEALQHEFLSLEQAVTQRCMTLLEDEVGVVLEHLSSLAEFTSKAAHASGLQTVCDFANRFVGHTLMEREEHLREISDVVLDFAALQGPYVAAERQNANRMIDRCRAWAFHAVDLTLQISRKKTDYFVCDVPWIAIATSAADLMYPNEEFAIELAQRFADLCDVRLGDALAVSKDTVLLLVQHDAGFAHEVIMGLDEMEQETAELKRQLIQPISESRATMTHGTIGALAEACSSITKCKLKLSTYEDYVPYLQERREDLEKQTQELIHECGARALQLEAMNERCASLTDECGALTKRLQGADEAEKGLVLRLHAATERIDEVQSELFSSERVFLRHVVESRISESKYEVHVEELSKELQTVRLENELLREGMGSSARRPAAERRSTPVPTAVPPVASAPSSAATSRSSSAIEKIPLPVSQYCWEDTPVASRPQRR